MEIKVQYTDKEMAKLEHINGSGNSAYIDLYLKDELSIGVGEFVLAESNVAMEIPKGYEAIILPRSSTFKKYGVLLANSAGLIDNSFKGSDDIWRFPLYRPIQVSDMVKIIDKTIEESAKVTGSTLYKAGKLGATIMKELGNKVVIPKGTRICQFRLVRSMEDLEIVEVDKLGNENRGGFGSTGNK